MLSVLKLFLNKSFSKLGRNCTVSNGAVAEVLETAAMTQDFLENTCKKQGNCPNADIIFKRISNCNEEKLIEAFLQILKFMIKPVKQKYNQRNYTLAIDTHFEAFYGNHKDLWIHGYKPVRGCYGSYKYITISIVIGNVKFKLLALPVHLGQDTAELVKRLILTAKKYVKVKLVLFDRGFYSGSIITCLNMLKVKYIIFAPQNKANKKYLKQTKDFNHKYFFHEIQWYENKSKQKVKVKLLIIKDFIDTTSSKIYDWIFATNLTHTKALTHVKLYKKRWGIETKYKIINDVKIKTVSKNYLTRFFLFVVRVLLYNLWKFYNLISQISMTFKEFIYKIFLFCIKIDYIQTCKQEMKLKISLPEMI